MAILTNESWLKSATTEELADALAILMATVLMQYGFKVSDEMMINNSKAFEKWLKSEAPAGENLN